MVDIFIRFAGDIDSLAEMLRELFNLPATNRSPWQVDQRRDSIDRGGPYYLFEVLAMELRLLSNTDAAEIREFGEYPYYLTLQEAGQSTLDAVARHLSRKLREKGIDNVVDVPP